MGDTFKILQKVREQNPLIHHITNWVTIYNCANIVRTVGGTACYGACGRGGRGYGSYLLSPGAQYRNADHRTG